MKYKDLEVQCEICGHYIKFLYPIPTLGEYHEDMYISHEMEYQERKDLQKRIDKALEYIKSVYKRNEDGTDNIWILDFGEIENILKPKKE